MGQLRQITITKPKGARALLLVSGVIIFFGIYCSLAIWFCSTAGQRDADQIATHSLVISNDLWNLNSSGMSAYLDLAGKTAHYKTMEVVTVEGDIFLRQEGRTLRGSDLILRGLGLIPLRRFSHPVYYQAEEIGRLEGEQYVRYIYPLTSIFFAQIFISFIVFFIWYLKYNSRLLETQVKERTRKYLETVNLLPEMVLETDTGGYLTFANENARDRLGLRGFDTLSQVHCAECLRTENGEGIDCSQLTGHEGSSQRRNEYKAKGGDGRFFPVIVRSAPMIENGRFAGARIIVVDITERKSLEKRLNQDQKMKSIGMMAGGVAHDLNNILSGIVNYPELILHKLPQGSPAIKLVEAMRESGLRAAAVVSDLLTVARGVAAVREVVSPNYIVQEYTASPEFHRLLAQHPNVEFATSFDRQIVGISCSMIHVRKCIMNLVTNAFEAVDAKGRVGISTKNVRVTEAITTEHGNIAPGLYSVVVVRDSGSGITTDDLNKIFEPFYSKKMMGRSGTGLGLTVVWNTLQDHAGGVVVTSNEDGTTFKLYFPASLEEAVEQINVDDGDIEQGNGESILVVDDEEVQRDIACRLLETCNYKVVTVSSGREAVEYVRGNTVDLIILDMILGGDMNGLQTYKEIITIRPGQKAIIVSGFSEGDDVKETIRLGAGSLVNKPYTVSRLAKVVHDELNRH